LQLSIYHTWYFRDDILTRPGGPTLDLLDGGTSGSGGGQPRHQVNVQLGVTNNGIGVRMTGEWQSATNVDGGTGAATGNLHFSSLATANLRLFADLGANPSLLKHRWARGMRVTLSIDNITNSRQHVRDANGDTPLSYQPAYLDPMGRTIKLSVRKLFF
ncbi:TonB-dependent receptor, partial [Nostoc sp. 3335mG]